MKKIIAPTISEPIPDEPVLPLNYSDILEKEKDTYSDAT